jgi:hypothetical protein
MQMIVDGGCGGVLQRFFAINVCLGMNIMVSANSHFLRNETCPRCRERGADRSGNNLGVFSDSHTFCWACGYGDGASDSSRIRRFHEQTGDTSRASVQVVLPEDIGTYIPHHCLDWLGKYALTNKELIDNKVLYSEKWDQLIFPYFDVYGNLLAWQGRQFGEGRSSTHKDRKWFSQGDLKKIYHILPNKDSYDTIVVVEDIVSAIKVSRHVPCLPLFGCNISKERLLRLSKLCSKVVCWLDPDKRREGAIGAARAGLFGMEGVVIFSERDPKEHSDSEIQEYLNSS